MNPLQIIASLILLSGSILAHPSLTLRVSTIDGLPERLLGEAFDRNEILSGSGVIDLAPALAANGCDIEEGESIVYIAATGTLIRNLDKIDHELVEQILDNLYRKDNLIATYTMYVDLLEKSSKEERLEIVSRIGFLPDPLVASLLNEIRMTSVEDPKPQEAARVEKLREALAELIEIALPRLQQELAVMDKLKSK